MTSYNDRFHRYATGSLVALLHIFALYALIEMKLRLHAPANNVRVVYFNFRNLPEPDGTPLKHDLPAQVAQAAHHAMHVTPTANRQALAEAIHTEAAPEAPVAPKATVENTPKLDLNAVIEAAKDIDHRRVKSDLEKLHESEAQRNSVEDRFGTDVAKAAREDCRTKYVTPDTNLLLLIPLAIETVRGAVVNKGCKW